MDCCSILTLTVIKNEIREPQFGHSIMHSSILSTYTFYNICIVVFIFDIFKQIFLSCTVRETLNLTRENIILKDVYEEVG